MVTQKELKAFYENDLKPKLLFFEEQRLLLSRKRKILWIIYGILVILAILALIIIFNLDAGYLQTIYRKFVGKGYLYYVDDKDVKVFVIFYLIIYVITFYMAIAHSYTKIKSTYRNSFKTTVVGSLVTFIDKDLSYTPKDNLTVKELLFKQEFHNSHLFRRREVYRWSGEDYVGGILGGTSLNFSEIHAETQYTSTKHSASVYYLDIFKGLFFVFNVNWNFEGVTTVIVPNDYWDHFLKEYLQLVKLAKKSEFKVYSDNPTIAKYVFSTAFMDRLLALHHRLKVPIELSFVNSKLYIAISIEEDLFEPPIYSTVLDFQLIQTIFAYIQLGQEIVEELLVLMKQPNQMDLE